MESMALACTINKEIATQKMASSNPYAQENSLSLTCCLPTEILSTIFIHCARDYHYHGHQETKTPPNWVNISYVCRHWRSVSLNCPTLWTYVFTTSQRWTRELLVRSGQASLKINVFCSYWLHSFCAIEPVLNYTERIQELCLHLSSHLCKTLPLSKLSSPAPSLQILMCSSTAEVVWPSVLFAGETPALHSLKLSGCPVPWHSFKLSGLTTFGLYNPPICVRPSVKEFLTVLSSMQALVHLYLKDALSTTHGLLSSGPSDAFPPRINLPHLARLLVVAPTSIVVVFMSFVIVPPQAEVKLQCQDYLGRCLSPEDCAQLTNLVSQRFDAFDNPAPCSVPIIHSLVLESDYSVVSLAFISSASEHNWNLLPLSLQNWEPLPIFNEVWDHNVLFRIILNGPMLPGNDYRLITDICRSVPMMNIQNLHIVDPPLSQDFWGKMLAQLPGLRCIKLSKGSMPNITSLLSLSSPGRKKSKAVHPSQDPDQILVPALEEIKLDGIEILAETWLGRRWGYSPANMEPFYNALSTRKDSTGRVTMTDCRVHDIITGEGRLFNMVGRWEGGRFQVVEQKFSERSSKE